MMELIAKKKRNPIQNHNYYEKNKERINQQNIENHRKPEIVEYIKNIIILRNPVAFCQTR